MNPVRVLLLAAAGIGAAVATYSAFSPPKTAQIIPRAVQQPTFQPQPSESQPYAYPYERRHERERHSDDRYEGWDD